MATENDIEQKEAHWRESRRSWNRQGLRFGLLLAIPLYPVFGLIDFVALDKQWFPLAIAIRGAISGIGIILLFLLNSERIAHRLVPISAFYTVMAGLGISALTFLSGGFDSTYFGGLNLVMLAAGMLFVWPSRVSSAVYVTLVLSYVLPSLLTLDDANMTKAVESTFFVIATAALLVIAQAYRHRSLRFESDAKLQLDELTASLKQANGHLEELSRVDELTRVANRRAFDERSEEEWNRSMRVGSHLTLLMLDVDNFKHYNDDFGHPQGDDCLQRIAQALQGALARPGDFLARYGGEEFVVVLPNTDHAGALKVAERIRESVEALGLEHSAEAVHDVVTISVGGASTDAVSVESIQELLQEADQALYRAKNSGRNRVELTAPYPAKLRESR